MLEILRPSLVLSVCLPGLFLAYLPVKQHLRVRPARLAAAAVPYLFFICLGVGLLCHYIELNTLLTVGAAALLCGLFYVCSLEVSYWKSVSIFLAVCASFSCLSNLARAIHALLYGGCADPWSSWSTALIYVLICWIFVLLSSYPATHAARSLLDDEFFARTWYVFWLLPVFFIGVDLLITPSESEILVVGHTRKLYITTSLVLPVLLYLFYAMFYLMADSLNRNNHLRQENLFLSMQQAQFNNLRTAICETREARHDMRHHMNTLRELAECGQWDALTDYLVKASDTIPAQPLILCGNPTIDAVASHYAALFQKKGIPFSFELDVPEKLPIPEIDLCLVLSNLLENAMEANLRTESARRYIYVQACLHSSHIILLTVKNAYGGMIQEKDGVLQSSKRPGSGVGTQSVRRIAEKNGGNCRFSYDNGMFCVNVMLRGRHIPC